MLLQIDVGRAYAAGAWASVIVLAQAAIEAAIRDRDTADYKANSNGVFSGDADLERISELRNELLHPRAPGNKSIVWVVPGGDAGANHAAFEASAQLAVRLMYRSIYAEGKPNQSSDSTRVDKPPLKT